MEQQGEQSKNPYRSPVDINEFGTRDGPCNQVKDGRRMLYLVGITSVLGGLDAWMFNLGPVVLLGPPLLFFVLAFWSVLAGTRGSPLKSLVRYTLAACAGALAAPSFELLLFGVCSQTIEALEIQFNHDLEVAKSDKLSYSLVTTGMIAASGMLLLFLIYWIPRKLMAGSGKPT